MKKILLITLVFMNIHVSAQKISASKVPALVKSAFARDYPKVSKVKWEKENGNYEANFTQNNTKMSATFEEHGGWLETETTIDVNSLPVSITDYVAKNYKGEKIKEAAKLKMANGDNNYEAEVKGMDLIFDTNGKFIKSAKD
jgi:hypothetical protein